MIIIVLSDDKTAAQSLQIHNNYKPKQVCFRTTLASAVQEALKHENHVYIFIEEGEYREPTIPFGESFVQHITIRGVAKLALFLSEFDWQHRDTINDDLILGLSDHTLSSDNVFISTQPVAVDDQIFVLQSSYTLELFSLQFSTCNILLLNASSMRVDLCTFKQCWFWCGGSSYMSFSQNMLENTYFNLVDQSRTVFVDNALHYNDTRDQSCITITQQATVDLDSNHFNLSAHQDPKKIVVDIRMEQALGTRGFDISISDNTFIECYSCIVCWVPSTFEPKYAASASLLIRNNFCQVKYFGIRIDVPTLTSIITGNHITLMDPTITHDSIFGIYLANGTRARVSNNEIKGTQVASTIGIKYSDANTSPVITKNKITNCGVGILCENASGVIDNNIISKNIVNLEIRDLAACNVHDNEIRESTGIGTSIDSRACPTFTNNYISHSHLTQVYVAQAKPIIRFNEIRDGFEDGIQIGALSEVRIEKNRISDHKRTGVISLDGGYIHLFDNVISRNGLSGVVIDETEILEKILSQSTTLNLHMLKSMKIMKCSYLEANDISHNEDVGIFLKNVGINMFKNDVHNNCNTNVSILFDERFVHPRFKIEEQVYKEEKCYQVIVEQNHVHHAYKHYGLYIQCGQLIRVDICGNVISDNKECGVYLVGHTERTQGVLSRVELRGNEICRTSHGSNVIVRGAAWPKIGLAQQGNKIHMALEDGIRVLDIGTRVAIFYNTIYNNAGNGVNIENASGGEMEENNVYDNRLNNICLRMLNPGKQHELYQIAGGNVANPGKSNVELYLAQHVNNYTIKLLRVNMINGFEYGVIMRCEPDASGLVVVEDCQVKANALAAIRVEDTINCEILKCKITHGGGNNIQVVNNAKVKLKDNQMTHPRKEVKYDVVVLDAARVSGIKTTSLLK